MIKNRWRVWNRYVFLSGQQSKWKTKRGICLKILVAITCFFSVDHLFFSPVFVGQQAPSKKCLPVQPWGLPPSHMVFVFLAHLAHAPTRALALWVGLGVSQFLCGFCLRCPKAEDSWQAPVKWCFCLPSTLKHSHFEAKLVEEDLSEAILLSESSLCWTTIYFSSVGSYYVAMNLGQTISRTISSTKFPKTLHSPPPPSPSCFSPFDHLSQWIHFFAAGAHKACLQEINECGFKELTKLV